MRVALVHDWLTGMRGGESVLESIIELFPDAELFTLLHKPGSVSPLIESLKIHTSPLQNYPNSIQKYRHYLPLMPRLIETFDLTGFDLIVSTSHCVAKGIQKPKGATHVSYVFAPMRYMWDRFDDYFGKNKTSTITRLAALFFRKRLQNWDYKVSQKDNVDAIATLSHFIQSEIKNHYGRDSKVIYPFVQYDRFQNTRCSQDFYLMVGAFAPYKRVDLAVNAFNELGLKLKIVGSGQDEKKVKSIAKDNIEFLGSLSNEEIAELYSQCKAFVFPGKEDFGITPLEALASGAPVIAFRAGGASETLTDETAVFFDHQDIESLKNAVLKIENKEIVFNSQVCRQRAKSFSKEKFQNELKEFIHQNLK